VVSCVFSALWVYLKFGHHPHCGASQWKKIAYSPNHSPSLSDTSETEACILEKKYAVKNNITWKSPFENFSVITCNCLKHSKIAYNTWHTELRVQLLEHMCTAVGVNQGEVLGRRVTAGKSQEPVYDHHLNYSTSSCPPPAVSRNQWEQAMTAGNIDRPIECLYPVWKFTRSHIHTVLDFSCKKLTRHMLSWSQLHYHNSVQTSLGILG